MQKNLNTVNIMIADDDEDDCVFFKDALEELNVSIRLTCFSNGAELMDVLSTVHFKSLPDILFLDMNMPLKNGMECLIEIRNNKTFDKLPIIIFSTSSQKEAVHAAYENGATFYLKKPDSFNKLKHALEEIYKSISRDFVFSVSREGFFIDV